MTSLSSTKNILYVNSSINAFSEVSTNRKYQIPSFVSTLSKFYLCVIFSDLNPASGFITEIIFIFSLRFSKLKNSKRIFKGILQHSNNRSYFYFIYFSEKVILVVDSFKLINEGKNSF